MPSFTSDSHFAFAHADRELPRLLQQSFGPRQPLDLMKMSKHTRGQSMFYLACQVGDLVLIVLSC